MAERRRSAADMAVDSFLKDALLGARPDYGWLSEETVDAADRLTHRDVFVVDPIDGTRAFIEGLDTWCVSIAIVSDGNPVAGVLVARRCPKPSRPPGPAAHGTVKCSPSRRSIRGSRSVRRAETSGRRSVGRLGREVTRMPHIPSLAYRLAMVADGRLDATLVNPKARDWDIAAADLILRALAAGS